MTEPMYEKDLSSKVFSLDREHSKDVGIRSRTELARRPVSLQSCIETYDKKKTLYTGFLLKLGAGEESEEPG